MHCHVEAHMMEGLAALVRAQQTVWLTNAQRAELEQSSACHSTRRQRLPSRDGRPLRQHPDRPLGGAAERARHHVHARGTPAEDVAAPVLGLRPAQDQTRLWDQATGAYTQPANQPTSVRPDQNIWSGAHAHLADAAGTILVHGGMRTFVEPPITQDAEQH